MFSSYERMFCLKPWELDCHSAEHGLTNAETTLWSVCPLGIVRKERDGLKAFEAFLPISEGHLLK